MPEAHAGVVKYHYRKQAIATLNQDPPVQNTWYTVLDTTEDIRVLFIVVRQIHDEAAALNLQIRVTIDGITIAPTAFAANNNTWYYANLAGYIESYTIAATVRQAAYTTDQRAQSFKLEVRMTGVPGTNQQLDGRCQYETLELT